MDFLAPYYQSLKFLHIIGFVIWVGGLLSVNRCIWVYYMMMHSNSSNDAAKNGMFKQAQWFYKVMANPAMMFTWTVGILMVISPTGLAFLKSGGWLHVKLTLLVLFTIYHVFVKKWVGQMDKGTFGLSGQMVRFWGFMPLVALVSIGALGVYKNMSQFGISFIIIMVIVLFLSFGSRNNDS